MRLGKMYLPMRHWTTGFDATSNVWSHSPESCQLFLEVESTRRNSHEEPMETTKETHTQRQVARRPNLVPRRPPSSSLQHPETSPRTRYQTPHTSAPHPQESDTKPACSSQKCECPLSEPQNHSAPRIPPANASSRGSTRTASSSVRHISRRNPGWQYQKA